MMARYVAFCSAILAAGLLQAQAAKSAAPRSADGKPDLTGVWQPGSTIPGSWEEANSGNGL